MTLKERSLVAIVDTNALILAEVVNQKARVFPLTIPTAVALVTVANVRSVGVLATSLDTRIQFGGAFVDVVLTMISFESCASAIASVGIDQVDTSATI